MKYKVTVETRRILDMLGTSTSTITVEASNEEEAQEKALKELYLDSPIARTFIIRITVASV